jgi:hypothetical protein
MTLEPFKATKAPGCRAGFAPEGAFALAVFLPGSTWIGPYAVDVFPVRVAAAATGAPAFLGLGAGRWLDGFMR